MSMLRYFAYGSNMSVRRLRARVPGVRPIGRATLRGHALKFHKLSHRDGTGKCDIVAAPGECVHGLLYEIDPSKRHLLDEAEGLGSGYARLEVEVETVAGDQAAAFTYQATLTRTGLRPLHWYRHHVLTGAREAGLPAEYIAQLEATETDEDADPERTKRELSVYD